MTMTTQNQNQTISTMRFWRNAAIVLAFTVIAVNLCFIIVSESTNPGLVNTSYNEYGTKQYLMDVQHRDQLQRGWKMDLDIPENMVSGKKYTLVLRARNADQLPILGGRAELACYRPSDVNMDAFFELKQSPDNPGEYFAEVKLDELGTWDINLLFEHDNKKHIAHQRVNIVSELKQTHTTTSSLEQIVNMLTGK